MNGGIGMNGGSGMNGGIGMNGMTGMNREGFPGRGQRGRGRLRCGSGACADCPRKTICDGEKRPGKRSGLAKDVLCERKRAYLNQGNLLDARIQNVNWKKKELRQMLTEMSSPCLSEVKVQTSLDGDAPFVKAYERMEEKAVRYDRELALLVNLKTQIDETIHAVKDERHQQLLVCRYQRRMKWEEIGDRLRMAKTTVQDAHLKALMELQLPEDPIWLRGRSEDF